MRMDFRALFVLIALFISDKTKALPTIDIVDAYNSYIQYGDKPKHILILENRLTTNTLKFNDGMILLRKYFDLFGLIESGLAIDKTTLNQKP